MKLVASLRSIVMTVLYPVVLVLSSITVLVVNFIFNNKKWDDYLVQQWARISCWMFGVKVKVNGFENVPKGGCVYVFNHTSFFDVFAMQGALNGFRFGAKIELFKIPVFGFAMRRLGALPIARHKRDEVFKVYEAAQARIERGEKFALAPEGTRQEEEKLGAFKAGPFVFAINAKAPVVPVVIRGAAAILPKGHWVPNSDVWTREITIDVLPPVDTLSYDIKDRPVLQEKVRKEMEPYFNQ
ncbi:lysophospholipid acyltransferase family protein [Bdellovibrio sp. HCB337]|uniref:lysophospholipid acyltransferase family protein n=1 Tax=Bdellovibrio sp. HCB337 TaxID=3394358 RepID=UPI0039A42791